MKYSIRKDRPVRLLGIAGSLREGSLNRQLLGAAADLAPDGVEVTDFRDLDGVPLFSEDLEALHPAGPGAVAALRSRVHDADGLLLATPEYNQSVPGVMKNLVDWLSRPDDAGVLADKPVAVMGATTGPWGTRYAQKELRHALTAAGALVLPQPMLFVPRATEAFDAAGRLADADVARRLGLLLRAFERWIGLVGDEAMVAAEA